MQFAFWEFLAVAAYVALLCVSFKMAGWKYGLAGTVLTGVAFIGIPRWREDRRRFWLLMAGLAVITAGWTASSVVAYHTMGSTTAGMIFLLSVIAHLLPAVASAGRDHRMALRLAAIVGLLILGVVVPCQAYLGSRLLTVEREVRRVVAYAEEVKTSKGQYPADLSGYRFEAPSAENYVVYMVSPEGFHVDYWVWSPSVAHWFDSNSGWEYYAD
jgi:hypothetical protein